MPDIVASIKERLANVILTAEEADALESAVRERFRPPEEIFRPLKEEVAQLLFLNRAIQPGLTEAIALWFWRRWENDRVMREIRAKQNAVGPLISVSDSVAAEFAVERKRQVEDEGYDSTHDDGHVLGELAKAAATYALPTYDVTRVKCCAGNLNHSHVVKRVDVWPWDLAFWRSTDRRRELVKAGALIIAEIERLDRAAQRESANAKP